MKKIERALATDIMINHTTWIEATYGIRTCTGRGCTHAYPAGMIPTPLDRLTHQLRMLEEAGFGFLPEGGK